MIDRNTQNMDEIVLEPIDEGKVEVMIKNGQGNAVGGLTGVTVHSGGQKLRIKFPIDLRHDLLKWFEDYKAHINDGGLVWYKYEWNDWYVRGWNIAGCIKELLPADVRMYYVIIGMSKGAIRCVDGCWQIKESLHHVEIVNDMAAKMKEGVYFPSVYGEILEDHEKYEEFDCTYGIYKIPILKSEPHLFLQDTVVLHNLDIDNQEDCMGTILEVHDDSIIVEIFGYMGCDEHYSLELIG